VKEEGGERKKKRRQKALTHDKSIRDGHNDSKLNQCESTGKGPVVRGNPPSRERRGGGKMGIKKKHGWEEIKAGGKIIIKGTTKVHKNEPGGVRGPQFMAKKSH